MLACIIARMAGKFDWVYLILAEFKFDGVAAQRCDSRVNKSCVCQGEPQSCTLVGLFGLVIIVQLI